MYYLYNNEEINRNFQMLLYNFVQCSSRLNSLIYMLFFWVQGVGGTEMPV